MLVDETRSNICRPGIDASLNKFLITTDIDADLEGLDLLEAVGNVGSGNCRRVHLRPFLDHAAVFALSLRLESVLLRLLLKRYLIFRDISLIEPFLRLHVQHVPFVKLTVGSGA